MGRGGWQLDAGGEQPVELTLVEVTEMGDRYYRTEGARAPFQIMFRGPSGLNLPQRIYPIEHETLGSMTLFLVPLQPTRDGSNFQAVFN